MGKDPRPKETRHKTPPEGYVPGQKQEGYPNLKRGEQYGQTGTGPKPKNKILTEELEKILGEEVPGRGGSKRTNARRLVEAMLKHAVEGNAAYAKAILDRVEGPVKQEVDVTSGGEAFAPTIFQLPANGRDEGT